MVVECPSISLIVFGSTPSEKSSEAAEWRRSWLCRRRHNHDYADLPVMPTSAGSALRDGVNVLAMSA